MTPLEDFGLDAQALREAVEPEQTQTTARDLVGLPTDPDDEPSYAEIIAAGIEALHIHHNSPRAVALMDLAQTADEEAEAGDGDGDD